MSSFRQLVRLRSVRRNSSETRFSGRACTRSPICSCRGRDLGHYRGWVGGSSSSSSSSGSRSGSGSGSGSTSTSTSTSIIHANLHTISKGLNPAKLNPEPSDLQPNSHLPSPKS